MTVKPTQEELMGYADGQLDAEQTKRIEQALASHPELRAAVEDHRRTRAAAREAVEAVTEAPLSPGLAKLAVSLKAPHRRDPDAMARQGGPRRMAPMLSWPIAAAACLVAGVVSAMLVARNDDGLVRWRNGPSAGAVLARVLEASPSGEASGNAKVVASFAAGDGRYCRQFEVGETTDGVACRTDGTWNILVLARRPGGAGSYQAAGGGDAVALAVAGLQPGPRIEGDAEHQLIARKWKD